MFIKRKLLSMFPAPEGRAPLPALLLLLGIALPAGVTAQGPGEPNPQRQTPAAFPAQLEVLSSAGIALVDIPLDPGERWCLAWNHSVTGIPVLDCYRYHDGRMVLERSHQPDFAAGLGHIPGRGMQQSDGEGGYWIEHIDEPVPGNRYFLRVGSLAVNHRIIWNHTVTSLSATSAGERVVIQLRSDLQ